MAARGDFKEFDVFKGAKKVETTCGQCVYMGDYTHRIHVWYIYLHLP